MLWDCVGLFHFSAMIDPKLDTLEDAQLEALVPKLFEPEAQEPVGVQLATFLFHECYHVGQLRTIRTAIGKAAAIQ